MLDPDHRALYADSLRPPAGYVFDEAIATTYTLGLDTLLTVPLQLALFDRRDAGEGLSDGVALLEALRRTSQRLSIFYQEGRIHVPNSRHPLYAMLEPVVHAVRAPGEGVFHAKLWVIRFVDRAEKSRDAIRVLVLSRNLTFDRSWDLSLRLDGHVAGGSEDAAASEAQDEAARAPGVVLSKFVGALPGLVADRAEALSDHAARAERLSEALAATRFELPPGFRDVRVYVHGLGDSGWQPAPADERAVISPFCDDTTIRRLVKATRKPVALISRGDQLDRLSAASRDVFERVLVLDEGAEAEDGEDTTGPADAPGPGPADGGDTGTDLARVAPDMERLRGLHAKAYLERRGREVHIVMGSANATRPGLEGKNVELLVDLVGSRKQIGDVRALAEGGGFGSVLIDHVAPDEAETGDAAFEAAESRLDAVRDMLARTEFEVECERLATSERDEAIVDDTGGDGEATWRLALAAKTWPTMDPSVSVRIWPVTISGDRASDIAVGEEDARLSLGRMSLVSLTGLIAFELTTVVEGTRETLQTRFVLNLPIHGLPDGREAALLQTVLRNQEGFLRYLALLLADLEGDPIGGAGKLGADWAGWLASGDAMGVALLEPLVRAFAREPEKLDDVRRVVDRICSGEGADPDVIPTEFLSLWASFEEALLHTQSSEAETETSPAGRDWKGIPG